MERTFVLTHGEAPKSMNAGGGGHRVHWATARDEKRRWEGIYTLLLLAERAPTHMEFCEAEATIRWKRRNHRDSTNYLAPVVKPLADALVKGGWLPDDTDEFFKFEGVSFEYPEEWPHRDPRVKAELVIRLVARYPEPASGARDG
jgi:hypothetical protein